MSFPGSPDPDRRSVLRATGVLLAAAGSSAFKVAARPSSGQKVSGQSVSGKTVPGRPPAGLQRAADQLVADGVPGVIIMTRHGQQVSHVVAGLADKATGQPMRPQDKVHIASITKTFVAAVVLQLAAERRLSLNDSVQQWLPGVITGNGYHPAQITIRQLLQHTSGLRDYTSDPHDGGWPGGFKTFAYTSPDGYRQAVMIYNDYLMSVLASSGGTGTPAFQRHVIQATEIAFCR